MDTIGDMLTKLLNAQRVGKERVAVPYSRFKEQLALLLQAQGVVASVRVQEGGVAKLIVTLAYDQAGASPLRHIARLSKPGRRLYVQREEIPFGQASTKIFILSTPQGLMEGQAARAA